MTLTLEILWNLQLVCSVWFVNNMGSFTEVKATSRSFLLFSLLRSALTHFTFLPPQILTRSTDYWRSWRGRVRKGPFTPTLCTKTKCATLYPTPAHQVNWQVLTNVQPSPKRSPTFYVDLPVHPPTPTHWGHAGPHTSKAHKQPSLILPRCAHLGPSQVAGARELAASRSGTGAALPLLGWGWIRTSW